MWIVGLLIGLAIGSSLGGLWAGVIGAIIGAIIGKNIKASDIPPPQNLDTPTPSYSVEVRISALEKQVAHLVRLVNQLQQRLNKYEPSAESSLTKSEETIKDTEVISTLAEAQETAPLSAKVPIEEPPSVANTSIPNEATSAEPLEIKESIRQKTSIAPEPPSLLSRLFSGNILAKIGVVLLFFGIASGIKLAAQRGLFPIELRLFIGACIAFAMIGFGWNRASQPKYRMFGLALQGGGFAVLYLLVYFMLGRYQLINHTLAFLFFMFLGVACIATAAKQNGVSLAVLGISGAFIAPIMASSNSGNHVALFSYFVLLNVFILLINWFKGWRSLNICGFLFTFIIGMAWGIRSYESDIFPSTQSFLIIFFLMYSLAPVLFSIYRAHSTIVWLDNVIIFGTPIAAAFSQAVLMRPYENGLAWSAFICGLYYLFLSRFIARQENEDLYLTGKIHLCIAVVLFTLTIPLAFDDRLTSALWAMEGAALFWTGVRQKNQLTRYFGFFLQLAAGPYFYLGSMGYQHIDSTPILNSFYIGSVIIALSGFFSGWLIKDNKDASSNEEKSQWAFLPTAWALIWWYGSGINESAHYFSSSLAKISAILLFVTASTIILETLGHKLRWFTIRIPITFLMITLVLIALTQYFKDSHVFAGAMLIIYPLALAVYYWILYAHEKENLDLLLNTRHLLMFWLLVFIAVIEMQWAFSIIVPNSQLLTFLTLGAIPALFSLMVLYAAKHDLFPVNFRHGLYLEVGLAPIAVLIGMWGLYANFSKDGGDYVLSYRPILSAFDLTQILVLFSLLRSIPHIQDDEEIKPFLMKAVYALAFIWVSAMAARIGHHWFGIPFRFSALYGSLFVQSMLSFIWTLSAITLMITATRRSHRNLWFTGFALLALVSVKLLVIDLANVGTAMWTGSLIGIALLVLAASYFSPTPPKEQLEEGA